MGWIKTNGRCFITGLPAVDINFENSNWEGYEYKIIIPPYEHRLCLSKNAHKWKNDPFYSANRHIIAGLLLNNNWIDEKTPFIESVEFFKILLNKKDYPSSPKEKRDYLFNSIYKAKSFEGDEYRIFRNKEEFIHFRYYLKNPKELHFYLNALEELDLINISDTADNYDIEITYEGLNYGIQIQEEGIDSNNCFIAMAFDDKTKQTRLIIKEAVKETGFNPILIDEKIIDCDKTINDEIINNIKKSKFCIADFSLHSNGVYFESGFALGQGKKVIYTCSKNEFEKAHFDIRPLQHIVYNDLTQLKKELINKIEVWIKK